MSTKREKRLKRARRVRAKIVGTKTMPRLSVYRSNKLIYVQAIDDMAGKTLASGRGTEAKEVGGALAAALVKLKIKVAIFDRGGYRYHGQVKELAEAIGEGGIKI